MLPPKLYIGYNTSYYLFDMLQVYLSIHESRASVYISTWSSVKSQAALLEDATKVTAILLAFRDRIEVFEALFRIELSGP
jgi:hypothetical protein